MCCRVESLPLPRGRYSLWIGAYEGTQHGPELMAWQPVSSFDVHGPEIDPAPLAVIRLAPVHVPSEWTIERV